MTTASEVFSDSETQWRSGEIASLFEGDAIVDLPSTPDQIKDTHTLGTQYTSLESGGQLPKDYETTVALSVFSRSSGTASHMATEITDATSTSEFNDLLSLIGNPPPENPTASSLKKKLQELHDSATSSVDEPGQMDKSWIVHEYFCRMEAFDMAVNIPPEIHSFSTRITGSPERHLDERINRLWGNYKTFEKASVSPLFGQTIAAVMRMSRQMVGKWLTITD
ncbi:hypothetical protein SLS59_009374 [Nothophoma quercina]|uniref:Uncharacterized protein n=1 Tax=Nothophoma quercina TaxID=749835 RepID=A0ABR3QLL9_9PLEO